MIYYYLCCSIKFVRDMSSLGSRPFFVFVFFAFCASRTVCIALGFYLFFDRSALPITYYNSSTYARIVEWPEHQQFGDLRAGSSPCWEGFVPFYKEDY